MVGKGGAQKLEIRRFEACDEDAVAALWEACDLVVPWNDPRRDIATKMAFQPELFLVGLQGEQVVASVMAGYEGHRGWINYLAVDPDRRGRGLGRRIMDEAERRLRGMGCPKVNLQLRSSNREVIAFYEHLGYEVEDRVSLGKRLGEK
jgi:ribosomal protein S18 acetylase RimI-like enzyme